MKLRMGVFAWVTLYIFIMLVLFFALPCAVSTQAKPQVTAASMNEVPARNKVLRVLNQLLVEKIDWQIFLIPDKDWHDGLKRTHQDAFVTGSAYSITEKRITYVNATWVMSHNEERIAKMLSHEWGHVLCNCFDEKMADEQGQSIVPWKIH